MMNPPVPFRIDCSPHDLSKVDCSLENQPVQPDLDCLSRCNGTTTIMGLLASQRESSKADYT